MPRLVQLPGYENVSDQLWVPIAFLGGSGERGNHFLEVIARMKPGVTLKQAQAEMETIAARLAQQYPEYNTRIGAAVVPLHEEVVGDISRRCWSCSAQSDLCSSSPAQTSPICCWHALPCGKRRSRCASRSARASSRLSGSF